MNTKRLLLYFALAAVSLMLWTTWEREHHQRALLGAASGVAQNTKQAISAGGDEGAVPQIRTIDEGEQVSAQVPSFSKPKNRMTPKARLITAETDLLLIKIDKKGGNIVDVRLKRFPVSLKEQDKPFELLSDQPDKLYVAESGMTGTQGPDTSNGPVLYQSTHSHYQMKPTDASLKIVLSAQDKAGDTAAKITKTFIFYPGRYAVDVEQDIKNTGDKAWTGNFYAQIRHHKDRETNGGLMHFHTFTGAAIYDNGKYRKLSYKKMDEQNVDKSIKGGWLAMQRRYFLSAWVPDPGEVNHYYSGSDANQVYTIGVLGPEISLQPQESHTTKATFYVGPEEADRLQQVAPGLDLTIDYGWLWVISMAIFWVMKQIYLLIGNWGWAIILVTFLIKLLFFKLSETSYRSMAKMKKLQPRLLALRERYANDKQRLSQATMQLYREEKVNPMGGCLPFLVQIPFFIALYYVLIESVELRHSPFIFWVQDLSAKDPFFVLPILMGVSMYFQQRMTPSSPDPTQAKMMMALPVVFTFLFMNFPSGLVLYWLTNNCLSILQQWYITRKIS